MGVKIKRYLDNVLFVLVVLLIFCVVFENKLVVPSGVQVIGRMHPLILHFPIVLLLLYTFLELLSVRIIIRKELTTVFLLIASLTATFTALAGVLLSKESGYDSNALIAHKWWGVSAAILSAILYYAKNNYRFKESMAKLSSVLISICLVVAGHFGSSITHGVDFLFAPMISKISQEDTVSMKRAIVYDHVITPIFKAKCFSCHNPDKKKGKLDLTTKEGFLKGGEDGEIVLAGNIMESKLIHVINLPLAHDEHMPPEGKAQLTQQEMVLLYQWVRAGADMKNKIFDISSSDSLRMFAESLWKSNHLKKVEVLYTFSAADPDEIKKLNTPNRLVVPLANESPALKVIFYNKGSFNSSMLSELSAVKINVVELDLHNMPIQNADLKTIGEFKNLSVLNLNYTEIGNDALKQVSALKQLQRLSLCGTSIAASAISMLSECKALKEIFIWNTNVKTADVALLQKQFNLVTFQTGFEDDGAVLKLAPPRLMNTSVVFSESIRIELSNPIQGAEIRFSVNDEKIDSVSGQVYSDKGISVAQSIEIHAQAFKEGWAKSDVLTFPVVRNSFVPDHLSFTYPPNPRYQGRGTQSLIDKKLAQPSSWHPGWVGFYEKPMELMLTYQHPVTVSSVAFSCLLDIGGYIFPPEFVEVWGGNEVNKLKLITTVKPKQPTSYTSNQRFLLNFAFEPEPVSILKIIAKPVHALPSWHGGKGKPGHFFLDEVGVN